MSGEVQHGPCAGAFPLRCEVFHVQFHFFMSYQVTRGGDRFASHCGDFAASARAFNAVHTYSSLLSVTWMCSPLTLTWIKLKWFKYIFWTKWGWPSIHQILISRRLWYCFWVEHHRKVGRCCCHSGGQWKLSVPLKNQVLPSGTGLLFLIWKLGSPRELRKSAYFSAGSLFFQEFSSKIVFLPF